MCGPKDTEVQVHQYTGIEMKTGYERKMNSIFEYFLFICLYITSRKDISGQMDLSSKYAFFKSLKKIKSSH